MTRSFLPACVGALGVIVASIAIAAGPHPVLRPVTESIWSSQGVSSGVVAAASTAPVPHAPSQGGVTFTHIEGAEAEALFGAEWPVEGEAFQASAERTPIPCYDIVINFAEEPESGISAKLRIRGRDLDGNNMIEADAGQYQTFFGEDEVDACTLTVYRHGVLDAVQTPVVGSAFQNASFFFFQWLIGYPLVDNLDSGSDTGPYVLAGAIAGGPSNSSFHQTFAGFGPFPSYTVTWGPCICDGPICDVDAIVREGEVNNGFYGAFPHDTTNGGCFSESIGAGFLTTSIAFGDKVCGQAGTTFLGRDTDWYSFSIPEVRTITVRTEAAFDMDVYIFGAAPDMCFLGFDYADLGLTPQCTQREDTLELPPGEYIIFCAPAGDPAVNPGSEYQLELIDSTACGFPVYDSDAEPREGESDCDASTDPVNGGCNDVTFPTTPIALGDKVRGTAVALGSRDTDWYLFTLEDPAVVTCRTTAAFQAQVYLLQGDPADFCSQLFLRGSASGPACGELTVTATLPPGMYVAFVSPEFLDGVECGSEYQLELTGTPISCPGDVNLDGSTNVSDFNILASNFRAGPNTVWEQGDLTGDGFVNVSDFNVLAGNFRCVGP